MANEKINIVVTLKDMASGQLKKVQTSLGKLKTAAVNAAKIGMVALTIAAGKAVKDFAKFEKGITNVYTLLNKDTLKKFGKELETGAKRVMEEFGFTIDDTNKALFDTVSAGVEAGKAIGFMEVAAKLAVGGVTDLGVSVDGLTSVMNAYGKENFDATKAANTFFTAQKFGKTTVAELAANIGKVAPIANAAGLSFEETAAALSTLTLAGLSTDLATTALKATLTGAIKPASDAGKRFAEMGIALNDANGEMRPFGDIMRDVKEATGGNVQELAKLFPNVRALTGVTNLASGALEKYDEILKETKTDTTSLDNAFKMQQKTFAQQWARFQRSMQIIGMTLAGTIMPALQGLMSMFTALPGPARTLTVIIGALAIAFAALGWPITATIAGVLLLGATFNKVKQGMTDVGGAVNYLKNMMISLGQVMIKIVTLPLKNFLLGLNAVLKGISKLSGGKIDLNVDGALASLDRIDSKMEELKVKPPGEEEGKKDNEDEIAKEDAKTALLLQKDKERNDALTAQQMAQREAKKALDTELAAIKSEEELAAFEAKLAKNAEQGQLTTQQELAIEGRRSELKKANWKKDFSTWLGIENLRNHHKKTNAEQMVGYENFMASASMSKNKEVAAIGKAIAIKNVTFKTAEAAMSGFAQGGPYLGPVLAAAAIAFGAEQISAINSGGTAMAEGGVVMPSVGGTQATIGEAGSAEAVIPLDDPEAQSMMGGGDVQVDVYISGKPLAKEMYETQKEMIRTGELQS